MRQPISRMISRYRQLRLCRLVVFLSLLLQTVAEELQQPLAQESSSKDLALPCSHPGHIEHGLTDWNGTGTVAQFACYQGYYLVGPPKLVCRSHLSPH